MAVLQTDIKAIEEDGWMIEQIRELYEKHEKEALNKMKDIIKKPHTTGVNYPNRFIALLREQNRSCNKEAEEKNIPMKKDGFNILFKSRSEKANWPEDFKAALKYL